MKDLENIIKQCYETAVEKGFYDTERSINTRLLLIICELCEAIEADRKNKIYDIDSGMHSVIQFKINSDEHFFTNVYETFIKDTVGDELAGACIRIFDFCAAEKIKIKGIKKLAVEMVEMSFPDRIFEIIKKISTSYDTPYRFRSIEYAIELIFNLADDKGINLEKFIHAAMRYNKTRPHMHCKKY